MTLSSPISLRGQQPVELGPESLCHVLVTIKLWFLSSLELELGNPPKLTILSIVSEFYYDDVTVTSFININMSTLPLKSSHNEQRAVVCFFLWAKALTSYHTRPKVWTWRPKVWTWHPVTIILLGQSGKC